ncbi:Pimeloyl-ACP methyl ester carboxylesterase [Friedmanniella luteola]|uniref:Pimeloyl-ACP methyl ester carboxylesterase n=1 Tax=Friedmanniella luteola TaxID=546871 RepID=A0A1H1QLU0_9ACTN|nr:alpha/beta hydrolase [Friedmanniella luteola]SDS23859.1 Pimeloyl-ACP methyl ester carboxylesterase [Friedmanniella luteola]
MGDAGEVPAETAGGIEIVYETFGDRAEPPVLLVMGLGTQLLGWRAAFCEALVERGHFVVRYDNRDIGLSTHLDDASRPDFPALLAGDASSAAYDLSDMADDAVALLDHLGLDAAHVVGASLGGMIAQTLALDHPERVLSLTSIMSTTGDRGVGSATEAAMTVLLAPPARSREEALERSVASARVLGSPGYPADPEDVRRRAGEAWDRDHDPAGVGRQLAAIYASGDRTARLAGLDVPTLVLHGADDALIDVSGGRATAEVVPGAELLVLEGMGHDLPEALWPPVLDAIAALVRRADQARAA